MRWLAGIQSVCQTTWAAFATFAAFSMWTDLPQEEVPLPPVHPVVPGLLRSEGNALSAQESAAAWEFSFGWIDAFSSH